MSNSSWIGSLNVQQYVSQQLQRESYNIDKIYQPQFALLAQKQSQLKFKQASYTQAQTAMTNFNQSLADLNKSFDSTYNLSLSVSGIATASIVGAATSGSHVLNVTQLAQSQTVASTTIFNSTTTALNTVSTLNFSVGNEQAPSASFTLNIAATDTLQKIADNINLTAKNNNSSVTASIVSTSDGSYQLVVSSNKSGLINKVNISESITSGAGINVSTHNDAQAGQILSVAKNALFTYDNLAFEQASNNNTISGVNLSLTGLGATTINLTETNEVENVKKALTSTLELYNTLVSTVAESEAQGIAPDPHLKDILLQLKTAMEKTIPGLGSFAKLSDIGIITSTHPKTIEVNLANGGTTTAYVTGLYEIDKSNTTFDAALNDHLSDIKSFLMSDGGLFNNLTENLLKPNTGTLWKTLNDKQSGGVEEVAKKLAEITTRLSDAQAKAKDLKSALNLKYAQLEMSLTSMQNTSLYLSAQLQLSGNK
jgi:flagellar hook-associated protein 2